MTRRRPRVVFIGPPASGKSRIGKALAGLLGEQFVDTDKVIASRYGAIPEIFDRHGEEWFREKEREVIIEALSGPGVVSLGGGAVANEDTRKDLHGVTVVSLEISEDAVAHRVTNSEKRPLLTGGLETWKALVATRQGWYDECASVRVDVSHRAAEEVAAEIMEWLTREEQRDH